MAPESRSAPHTLCAGDARVRPETGVSDSAWMAAYALAEIQSRSPMPGFGTKGSQIPNPISPISKCLTARGNPNFLGRRHSVAKLGFAPGRLLALRLEVLAPARPPRRQFSMIPGS